MSYAKSKGTAYESAILKYFTECGFTTGRRIALAGASGDKGDLWFGENPVKPSLVIECKNYAKALAYKQVEDFIQEAHTEYLNATNENIVDTFKALLLIKRTNLGTADSWLIWKNVYGITTRCRLGDVVNKENFANIQTETERIIKLTNILYGKKEE